MSSDTRILNISRNCRLKLHQAEARIKAGVAAWVEPQVSIRELSLKEIRELRESKAHIPDYLASSELPGLRWEPPASEKFTAYRRNGLIREAREFYNAAV